MRQYDFVLNFALGQSDADPEAYLARLEVEGCDDALVGLGQQGRIALDFARQAPSACKAILSAISDVKRAIPDAILVEASPDLVGLTDIAKLLGFSRQYMRKLVMQNGADFPLPVHEGKSAIWHLAKVLLWFRDSEKRHIDESLFEIANMSMQCNLSRHKDEVDPDISIELQSLFA